ncbi:hypothetical protein [Methanococcoides sp. FTZ1]|uniref:hypothetical protein n=1 Tax=Methanococcoides sp. FTZ1 TaxID=3439061 RepID=UPI003F85DB75
MKQEAKVILTLLLIGLVAVFASGCVDEEPVADDTMDEADTSGTEEDEVEDVDITDEEEMTQDDHMDDAGEYDPVIDPENFVEVIDNPYFPLIPGTTFIYEGENEDGELERNEVYVTDDTRVVMGVTTTVVHDRVWEDGELIEETFDWYAQDKDGNVWYFGEDSKEYEDGEFVSDEGTWEAGIDDAKPGIVMKMEPVVGDIYRQEYLVGEAEDMAEVVSLTETVTVEYGTFENCLVTKEWTPLEPGVEEQKYYAKGVGQLLEEVTLGGSGQLELIDITTEM